MVIIERNGGAVRIDLHAHTDASDGTLTPADLLVEAVDVGLDVVAVTDHDTTSGWAAAQANLPPGTTFVPGIELSCRWYGIEPSIGLHLLAYLFDPAHPALAAELARIRLSRQTRARRMVELMRGDGIDITWDEVLRHAAGSVGRPHLARALVDLGMVDTVQEAFGPRWLGERYRLYKEDLDVFAALKLAREAGGVTVFAHPRATVRGRVVPDRLIADMAAAGLDGLEADHDDHSPEQRAHIRALAGELGLVTTGGSDFHGANKTVALGANTTARDQYERLVAAATFGAPVIG